MLDQKMKRNKTFFELKVEPELFFARGNNPEGNPGDLNINEIPNEDQFMFNNLQIIRIKKDK